VEYAPRVGDVEEAVLDERCCFDPFVASLAAERDRKGELEILDVVPVDARKGRETLAEKFLGTGRTSVIRSPTISASSTQRNFGL
jgi:hypothetical protein